MKTFRGFLKATCVLLILVMLFTGCASNKPVQSSNDTESTDVSSGQAGTDNTANTETAEVEKIVFASVGWGEQSRDQEEVFSKLKEITREKINVEADIKIINVATYAQQINMMMASADELDLFFLPFGVSVNLLVTQNQLMAIDELLEKYGQDIVQSLGSLLDYGKYKDKTYAVPFNGSKVYPVGVVCNENILNKYNLSLDSVKSYKDLEKIYEAVKQNEPEMVCLAPNQGSLIPGYEMIDKFDKIDTLGDNIGVLIGNDNYDLVNLFETEEYKDLVYTLRDWYLKGYILKDAATTTENGSIMYNQGKVFSYLYVDVLDTVDKAYHHPGISQQGQPSMVKALNKPIINSSVGFYSTGISSQSKKPEAAMKWFNLMYKDEEAVNTIYWGIEGKHFVKEADGTISFTPEEAENRGYDTPFNWMFGNTALQYTFKSSGYSADYFKQRVRQNDSAEISNAFGFSFDITPVQAEYTAVSNVMSQYQRALECGSVDPAVELPNFINKLKEAGIDKVIAEKQKQLDAWAAENKK